MSVNEGKKIFDAVVEELEKEPDSRYFLGGSRRFGYARPQSDWDLFMLDQDVQLARLRRKGLEPILTETDTHGVNLKTGAIYRNQSYIHIVIVPDNSRFENLKEEHEMVEKFLRDHSEVLAFIRQMRSAKETFMPGHEIYRSLLVTATEQGY